jgi:flagellar motor switch protein FliM
MLSTGNPAETGANIVERLVGDTGEPEQVIAAAHALAERTLAGITSGLEEAFGIVFAVSVKAVVLGRCAAARPASTTGNALTVVASKSSPDAMIMLLDAAGIATLVSAVFGGDPDLPLTPIERELSPTEIGVATSAFHATAEAFNGDGTRSFQLAFPIERAITGAELAKLVIRDGPGVRMEFQIANGAAAGVLAVTMPQRVLLKHRGNHTDGGSSDWSSRFNEEVMRSKVTLDATMPLASLTLGAIAGFKPGDLVELDEGVQERAKLSTRGRTLFLCEFGRLDQNYTVRVERPFDPSQDFIDGLMPA